MALVGKHKPGKHREERRAEDTPVKRFPKKGEKVTPLEHDSKEFKMR